MAAKKTSKNEHAKKYPMCEKLSEIREDRFKLSHFIDWLREQGIWLCSNSSGYRYSPIPMRMDDLILKYFEIDQDKLEIERRQILEEHRKMNEK